KSSRLSREDIEGYTSSSNSIDKNTVEQKANSDQFNENAFDGWEENNFDTSLMKNLDKKFLPKSSVITFKSVSLTIAFGILLSVAFTYNQNKKINEPSTSNIIAQKDT